ncbi:ATP-binding cassette domain-containing protein [Latilactobacillus curvatus]|jgi:ABC-2 type transport system ATP-binding protein|uniref:ATP-binding cassette domain-containing protein n=2 Tax=Latilactobacillus curvatus TaxID=28038 RepID=A0A1B2A3Y6_LATCU|nr:ATP-binding cassette domain-containing protein [Latilactobacillus curvatus]ANY12675.1 hypothetical protein BCY75_00805 [Latilactobacillus curvatus]ASN61089.1 hypothetical protein CGZ47_00235 [Latilactobacillus curvatus]AWV72067.1 ATP-binding cassette domain-containing protein [Latilactobacillus curvatus]AXN34896.1 ATP-binding cassette domain-containing protein [Latilactobacillus curvatus]KRK89390.1 ABC transporter family protein [Latilactobacillus curvatus JCM 1096 = DSM 20019]
MGAVLELRDFSQKYQRRQLFKRLNLRIDRQACIAITGQNGAGKTTLLNVLAGLTNIERGTLEIAPKMRIGYMAEQLAPNGLTPKTYLRMLGELDQFSNRNLEGQINELAYEFGLAAALNTPLNQLSRGSLQKVNFVQAILRTPDILLLDEPLAGQDGTTQMRMIHWLKDYRQKGGAIIVGTNNAFLIEQLATEIYELDAMRLLPIEELPQPEEKVMRLEFATTPRSLALPATLQQLALKIVDGTRYVVLYANIKNSDELIQAMLKSGFSLRGLRYEVL